jgi:uncharacterized repeat protein (TIGR03803 family)
MSSLRDLLFVLIRNLTAVMSAIFASCGLANAQASLEVIHDFAGSVDGTGPQALIAGSDGYLYGTTLSGGGGCSQGCGTIFRILPDGTDYTVVYAFNGDSDGAYPSAGLLETSDGTFYGTTMQGGNSACGGRGCGTVFRMDPDLTVSIVHVFPGSDDGAEPAAGLIKGDDGNLYGTTFRGGGPECVYPPQPPGCGTVFRLTPDGIEILHRFHGGESGAHPLAALVRASDDGVFYGTTFGGGGSACADCGTVFQIDGDGNFSVLYAFSGGSDGRWPEAALIAAGDGRFYGTTYGCALFCGDGTVFQISASGTVTGLHEFIESTDGAHPAAALLEATDGHVVGHLYGTTSGGPLNRGTIFQIDPDGTFVRLYTFSGPNGAGPRAALIGSTGTFYGTASYGGAFDKGVLFRLTVP